ncbi:SH3 domain-containing protein [Leptospira bouyouniensis]|uniref:SH3 domain-containing protein n=1 Tax=Leptospira bouyouniensis TaxID=2484911 RepID=A0ABY2L263_9LEPT|nr:SH3 domain-containing protein [Leptospira bouyouniensis]TGK48035.1 SH3 domain-containing protein [Leptospira bouyouniensis]
MRNLILFTLLFGCTQNVESQLKSEENTIYLPEMRYLAVSHVPLSREMKQKIYPDTWNENLYFESSLYKVKINTSAAERRNLNATIAIKESLNIYEEGREKVFYFKNGNIFRIVNTEPVMPPDRPSYPGDYGLRFDFKNGKIETVGCYFRQKPCQEIIHLDSSGEVVKVVKEKAQCEKGCGHLVPYRIPGSYFVADHKVRVRKEPSIKSEISTELKKDTPIEVIADTEIYEEIFPHYGTWAKVRLDDGSVGFVYGAFLRAPGEIDVVAIREKANEWKKMNGWREK